MGPMACINRWFLGLYSCPNFCESLAAIGTADTPELPIKGFTFPPVIRYKSFAMSIPPIVPKEKATKPKIIITIVLKI